MLFVLFTLQAQWVWARWNVKRKWGWWIGASTGTPRVCWSYVKRFESGFLLKIQTLFHSPHGFFSTVPSGKRNWKVRVRNLSLVPGTWNFLGNDICRHRAPKESLAYIWLFILKNFSFFILKFEILRKSICDFATKLMVHFVMSLYGGWRCRWASSRRIDIIPDCEHYWRNTPRTKYVKCRDFSLLNRTLVNNLTCLFRGSRFFWSVERSHPNWTKSWWPTRTTPKRISFSRRRSSTMLEERSRSCWSASILDPRWLRSGRRRWLACSTWVRPFLLLKHYHQLSYSNMTRSSKNEALVRRWKPAVL